MANTLTRLQSYFHQIGKWECSVQIAGCSTHKETHFIVRPRITKSQTNGAWERLVLPGYVTEISEGELIRALRKAFPRDALLPCVTPNCGAPAWNRKLFPSEYRDNRCEDCWMLGWRAGVDEIQKDRLQKNSVEDAGAKRAGYTHKTVAWVHPRAGDDFQLIWHSKGPLPESWIHASLKQEGSTVFNDFRTTEL